MSVTYWQVQAPVGTPLAGISQWAGTSGGTPGQPAPLGAVRNGTGRYWFGADYNTPLAQPGTTRPMAPFSTSAANVQGYIPSIQLGSNEKNIGFQGSSTGSISLQYQGTVMNIYISSGAVLQGQGGVGGKGADYALRNSPSPFPGPPAFQFVPGAPGSAGSTLFQITPSQQITIYNAGSVYGGYGGGGGGNAGTVFGGGGGGGSTGGAAGQDPGGFPGWLPFPRLTTAQAGGSGPGASGGQGGSGSGNGGGDGRGTGGAAGGAGQAGSAGLTAYANQVGYIYPISSGGAVGASTSAPVTWVQLGGVHN